VDEVSGDLLEVVLQVVVRVSVMLLLVVVAKVDISIMCVVILHIVGYDRRRPGLSNAPLDRRYDKRDVP